MPSVTDPQVLNRLVVRLNALRPETPRRWGTMSAGEMLCHLADSAGSILSRPGGKTSRPRRVTKWLALYTAIPWPRGIRTPAEVDPRLGGTRPAEFERDRARAIEGLLALAGTPEDGFPRSHSRFGDMTAGDWCHWAYRHTDHHLRQFGL